MGFFLFFFLWKQPESFHLSGLISAPLFIERSRKDSQGLSPQTSYWHCGHWNSNGASLRKCAVSKPCPDCMNSRQSCGLWADSETTLGTRHTGAIHWEKRGANGPAWLIIPDYNEVNLKPWWSHWVNKPQTHIPLLKRGREKHSSRWKIKMNW